VPQATIIGFLLNPSYPPSEGQLKDAEQAARAMEPPRFCPACRRRMKVQVLPAGWRAVCVEHGVTTSA